MKNLEALLSHATRNDENSNLSRMKNCHLANQIVGRYARGGTREMAERLHKSDDTIEDYARAARVYMQLLNFCWYCEREERTRNFRALSEIIRGYGYTYLEALFALVVEQEDPRAAFEQLRIVMEERTIISKFRGVVNPSRFTEYEIALVKMGKAIEILQKDHYGMEPIISQKARFMEHFMNGCQTVHCPACAGDIDLQRFIESQEF